MKRLDLPTDKHRRTALEPVSGDTSKRKVSSFWQARKREARKGKKP